MTQRIDGGRTNRVNGLALSDEENDKVLEAARRLRKSKAEFIRDAAYDAAIELLAGEKRPDVDVAPEDLADPVIGRRLSEVLNLVRARRAGSRA